MTDIISPLPFTLTNGTTADASQVMADLDQIRNDVNVQVPAAIATAVAAAGGHRGAVVYALSPGFTIQTVGNNLLTLWDTVLYDTDTIWSALNPERLTVPSGVSKVKILAQINGTTGLYPAPLSDANISLLKNGIVMPLLAPAKSVSLANPVMTNLGFSSYVISCSPGDYFSLYVNVGNNSFTIQDREANFFSMEVVE